MGKLGKRKLAELAENQKNGSGNAAPIDDENGKNERESSSVSQASSLKYSGDSAKKRKVSAASSRPAVYSCTESDNDSDDMPLNGSKSSSTSEQRPQKKERKVGKPKSNQGKPAASNGNKKEISNESNEDEDEEEEEEEKEYEVEAIVGHKTMRGAAYFCVRWKGYGKNDDTWELEADLNCDALIEEYRKKADLNDTKTKQKGKKSAGSAKSGGSGSNARGRARGNAPKSKSTEADPNKEWAVERIIQYVEDDEQGGLYRIRWKGFGAKDDTWEPESNLSCVSLIEKFKKGMERENNVDTKHLRESPKKTKRLVNETIPRSNLHNRIERSSKRSAAKNRVFYGEE